MKKKLSLILAFMLFACNNKNDKDIISKREESKKYRFDFPDTLIVNKKYNGVLHYKSKLDSISSKIGDSENYRYSRLLISKTKKLLLLMMKYLRRLRILFGQKTTEK